MFRSVKLLRVVVARFFKLSVVNSRQDCTSSDVNAGAARMTSTIHLGATGEASREVQEQEEKSRLRREGRDGRTSMRGCAVNAEQPLKLMQLRPGSARDMA